MADSNAVLRLVDVCKTYRMGQHQVKALRGASLSLQEGEMLALTGPSGSGKSTLLNIAGLVDCTDSGEVLLGERIATRLSSAEATVLRRERIGFVFQGFNLVPVMSSFENVEYPLFLSGVNAINRRLMVNRMLHAVGLFEHAAHKPDALSGGQRQRLAIARALVKQPALVIADEPTANLDSHTAEQVLDLMREQGRIHRAAFLIATHDQRLLARCDRQLHLLDGQVRAPASAALEEPV